LKAVFGLGNPGLKYVLTRHNVGFQVVDLYRKNYRVRKKGRILCSSLIYQAEGILLVKPRTHVNASGEAASAVVSHFGLSLAETVIVYDDLDLPFGRMRVLPKGGAGSHNGMRSILSRLDCEDVPRLRIGIGREPRPDDTVRYVLGRFTPEEWRTLLPVLERATEAVELFRTADIQTVMNCFNRQGQEVAGQGDTAIL
jgi:PTH1 family peptidyl-tRNA hydrolase